MGTDCVALLGRRSGEIELAALLSDLDALNPRILEWWPKSKLAEWWESDSPPVVTSQTNEPWHVAEHPSDGNVAVTGSRQLRLEICARAVVHWAEPRWGTFVTIPEECYFVRQVCRGFANVFGSDRAI